MSDYKMLEIRPETESLYHEHLDAMWRQRYDIFVKRKGWALAHDGSREIDTFDKEPGRVYLVLLDAEGQFVGGTRLLEGSGHTLSSGPLNQFWTTPLPARPPGRTYETSRSVAGNHGDFAAATRCLAHLFVGCTEWAVENNVNLLFGVGDSRFVGAMTAAGMVLKLHSLPIPYPEGGEGIAVSWPINMEMLETMRKHFGIFRPVLAKPETLASLTLSQKRAIG